MCGGSLPDEKESLLDGCPKSGYSISVVQTSEGTKVQAKVGNGTDVRAFRAQLEQQYPNAKIEIEGGKAEPLIREISTKTLSEETVRPKPNLFRLMIRLLFLLTAS